MQLSGTFRTLAVSLYKIGNDIRLLSCGPRAGFAEVILYFNVGLKPHNQVKEEMDRFMREVAPAFAGGSVTRAA